MFHPHLTFDLCSANRRESKSRPWAYWWKAEVCELRHGAGEEPRHDHMHFLPAAGHDQRHLQSWDLRVAHVLTLHLLRVGVWLRPPEPFHSLFHVMCCRGTIRSDWFLQMSVALLQVGAVLLPDPLLHEQLQGCVPHLPSLQQGAPRWEEKMLQMIKRGGDGQTGAMETWNNIAGM